MLCIYTFSFAHPISSWPQPLSDCYKYHWENVLTFLSLYSNYEIKLKINQTIFQYDFLLKKEFKNCKINNNPMWYWSKVHLFSLWIKYTRSLEKWIPKEKRKTGNKISVPVNSGVSSVGLRNMLKIDKDWKTSQRWWMMY